MLSQLRKANDYTHLYADLPLPIVHTEWTMKKFPGILLVLETITVDRTDKYIQAILFKWIFM